MKNKAHVIKNNLGSTYGECNDSREAPIVDWADLARAELSTPTVANTELWLVVTARADNNVFHWVQGPTATDGTEARLQIALPAEVIAASVAVGRPGTLRARLVTHDAEGATVGESPLETLFFDASTSPLTYGLLRTVEWPTNPANEVSADL